MKEIPTEESAVKEANAVEKTEVADKASSSSFVFDVLKIASGTTFAQALTIIASPVLTRLYGPEAFGLSALFASLMGLIGVISCMRYERAIMLPKEDEDAANLLGLCMALDVLICTLTVPLIWLGGEHFLHLIGAPELGAYLWLIPPAAFLSGAYLALNYWNSRTKYFGRLSISRIISSVATTGTQLGAGFSGYTTGGSLIGASLTGSLVSTLVLGGQIWRDDRRLFSRIGIEGLVRVMRRYSNFPRFSIWSSLINALSLQLPAFLLSTFFSPVAVGYYAISVRVLYMPSDLIGTAISHVFFQRASVAKFEGDLATVVESTFKRLVMIGLFPMFFLSFFGRDVFFTAFGARWAEAGIYAQILAIWIFFSFISNPISTSLNVLERQNIFLIFEIFLFSTRAGSLFFGGLTDNIYLALVLFSASGVFAWACMCAWIFHELEISLSGIAKMFAKYIGYSLMALSIPLFLKFTGLLNPLQMLIPMIIAAILYYAIIFKDDREAILELRNMLKGKVSSR